MLPTYCLPVDDVRTDLFTTPPPIANDAFLIDHDVEVDGVVVSGSARRFRNPPPNLQELEGLWTFTWDQGVSCFEEAIEVHVHARDVSKRVDVLPSDRHVRIELDGEVVAESVRPHALFETALPTRWYLPLEAVRNDLLVPSNTVSRCPYKGKATYWSVQIGDAVHRDIAWTYREPVAECPRVAGSSRSSTSEWTSSSTAFAKSGRARPGPADPSRFLFDGEGLPATRLRASGRRALRSNRCAHGGVLPLVHP